MTTATETETIETTGTQTGIPAVGVYRDIPAETYHSWKAVSSSILKAIAMKSPAHGKALMDGREDPDADESHFIVGSAAHAAALQPSEFARVYAIGPDVKLNTNAGKAQWAEFVEANPGKVHVRGADGPVIEGVRKAVWAHPLARQVLDRAEDIELSIVWTDLATGLLCKCRPDVLCPSIGAMPDLKTTRSSKPDKFAQSAFDLGYHVQMAFYLRGLRAAGFDIETTPIIAVEKSPPFACTVFGPDQTWMDAGESEADRALTAYAQCEQQGFWPAYSEAEEPLSLSAWNIKKVGK